MRIQGHKVADYRSYPGGAVLAGCHNLKLLNQFRITKLVKHHTLDIYLIYATT